MQKVSIFAAAQEEDGSEMQLLHNAWPPQSSGRALYNQVLSQEPTAITQRHCNNRDWKYRKFSS